ncbi:MAG: type IX secretion system membrane protein PorP/SprF [Flavobacteriales bacterium]|jgi:hypothetical protein|nr:type IX secretion system membrane protein PorP/SprF [Flavobacteriales bacterium]
MSKQLFLLILFLPLTVLKWGQDSTTITQSKDLKTNTIAYIQFNSIRDAANIGIQGRNITLRSFSNLPNPSFTEIHNSVNIDGYLDKNNSVGLGLYYSIDNWSNLLFRNTLGFGFKKKIKNFHLGINIEKNTLSKDSAQLTFGDMIDPSAGIIYPTNDNGASNKVINYLNFSPSIIYSNNKLKIGLSLNNITEPNQALINDYTGVPMETNITISYLLRIKQKWAYIPMINYNASKHFNTIRLSNLITYYAPRKIHFLAISYIDKKWLSSQYGINFSNRFKFFGEVNFPIYYTNLFPISAQLGAQYTFKPKR